MSIAPSTCLLLVAYGSTRSEARESYAELESLVRACYPEQTIFWAFSSQRVCSLLHAQGVDCQTVAQAVQKMLAQGFRQCSVLPFFIIEGEEYNGVRTILQSSSELEFTMGRALLYNAQSVNEVAQILMDISQSSLDEKQSVVWVAHGSPGSAHQFYVQLDQALQKLSSYVRLAVIEGEPSQAQQIQVLRNLGAQTFRLYPFLLVAGNHVWQDFANGEGITVHPGSLLQWKSIINRFIPTSTSRFLFNPHCRDKG